MNERVQRTDGRNDTRGACISDQIEPRPVQRLLHLLTLNAFAIAIPLTDRLQNNVLYLKNQEFSPLSVACALACLLLIIPVLCFSLQQSARWFSSSVADRIHQLQVLGFLFLFLNLSSRWVSGEASLRAKGAADSLMILPAFFGAVVLTTLYRRLAWLRQVLSLSSVVLLFSPLTFFSSDAVRSTLMPAPDPGPPFQVHAGRPVPIVIVVLDGCSGISLMDSMLQVDSLRFPSFGRLAGMSTWYRNATSVHPRTNDAVPAILTGCRPRGNRPPLESQYPPNLFRIIYETGQYSMSVHEPFTSLCPEELSTSHESEPSDRQQPELLKTLQEFGSTLSLVYLKMSIPSEFADQITAIPRHWFSMGAKKISSEALQRPEGLKKFPWDVDRRNQFHSFVCGLGKLSRPFFSFLHVVMPHDPWIHFPSGHTYLNGQQALNLTPENWNDDEFYVMQMWQRYLLQLQYVDAEIGRMLDTLEQQQLLDESLVIVTADHGMAFVPGLSRREPTPETLADIMSVPLFVKLPGQRNGEVSDRNAETIDLLPSIADIIDLTLPEPVEGISFLDAAQPAALRKSIAGIGGDILVRPEFPEKQQAVDRLTKAFGSGSHNNQLGKLNSRPELIGRHPEDFVVGELSDLSVVLECGGIAPADYDQDPMFTPCLFEGVIPQDHSNRSSQVELAICLNSVIQATIKTSYTTGRGFRWQALIPESAWNKDQNIVQFFEVVSADSSVLLREIR